ncbi:MAG: carboxymuconolactone decarboxylase family protein [Firmicutes bacterium]|jgi:alkylhydroperoxidase/carboxymuconolactone decarboxylase family protein YurZ|nr:carboxymuconolactone decarboxylase family protein [Bacillota bacterium]
MSSNPLAVIEAKDKKLYDNLTATRKMIFEDGALGARHKLLIAMALDAALGASAGVKSLALQAMEAGATEEEIMEAIRVAYYVTGAASVYTAAAGLQDVF